MANWNSTTHRIAGDRLLLPSPSPRRVLAAGTTVGTPPQEAVFNTNWSDFDATQYVTFHKDALGFVRIQGCMKRSAAVPGTGEVAFTLPVGYRPDQVYTFSNCTNDNAVMVKVVVYPTDYATVGLRGTVQVAVSATNSGHAGTATYTMCTFRAAPQGNS